MTRLGLDLDHIREVRDVREDPERHTSAHVSLVP